MLQDEVISTRVILNEDEWDAIRSNWIDLYQVSPYASTPLAFEWLRNWWQVYRSAYGSGGLRIVTMWCGPRLIGILPLYLDRGAGGPVGVHTLRFISTGEAQYEETCPDYLNLLCLAGTEEVCIEAARNAVSSMDWDHLHFTDIPENSPLLQWQDSPPGDSRSEVISRGTCPVADLGQGFESYIRRLSAKTRQHARQYLRSAERVGATFELATESNTDQFFDGLVSLHQERWLAENKPGCFAAPRFTEFHRSLAREWIPKGRAALARLSHQGQVYAVLYGFITCSKFDFYQSGIRRANDGPFDSPGTTANLLLMAHLAERKVTHYDFLRGSSSYKERLATDQHQLVSLLCRRSTFRATIDPAVQIARRGVRKVIRLLARN